eukprot:32442_1
MSGWECKECGLLNLESVNSCIACFNYNYDDKYWKCKSCDLLNETNTIECIACYNINEYSDDENWNDNPEYIDDSEDAHNDGIDYWPDWDRYTQRWVDYTTDIHLKQLKATLPFSIQEIIKFSYNIYRNKIVIDLNFEKIERDLKLQYHKYNDHNPNILKKLYSWSAQVERGGDYKETQIVKAYNMFFGKSNYTLPEYLSAQITFNKYCEMEFPELCSNDKIKIIKQLLKYFKLLIVNGVLDVYDSNETDTYGTNIWQEIQQLSSMELSDNIMANIMDDIVGLIVSVESSNYERAYSFRYNGGKQEAILNIMRGINQRDENGNQSHKLYLMNSITYSHPEADPTQDHIFINHHGIIDKLLFRGMLPFQFVHEEKTSTNNDENLVYHQPITSHNMKQTKHYIQHLVKEANIYEKILDAEDGEHYPYTQMIMLSPLILLPHSNGAHNMMMSILSQIIASYTESDNLSKQISTVISGYLFVDFSQFYDIESIKNNINSKCILLLNDLWTLNSDAQITTDFDAKYGDNKEFFECLKKDYLNCLMRLIAIRPNIHYRFLMYFMKQYNKYDIYPLKCDDVNGHYGMYTIISWYSWRGDTTENGCKRLIEFLRYCKSFYGKEFDINLAGIDKQRYIKDKIIQQLIYYSKPGSNCFKLIEFILDEFEDEYDRNHPCLLCYSIQRAKYESFEFLVGKYKNEYKLKLICDTLKRMITDMSSRKIEGEFYFPSHHKENKEFLKNVEKYCLNSICETEQDKQMLNECIIDSWKVFAKTVEYKYKEW